MMDSGLTRGGLVPGTRGGEYLGVELARAWPVGWDLGRERPQLPARERNLSPIRPRASIAGRGDGRCRSHHDVLAAITTGTVLLVAPSAAELQ